MGKIKVPFRCAKSGVRFHAYLEKKGSSQRYTIVQIKGEISLPSIYEGDGEDFFYSEPECVQLSEKSIDWTGFYCPACGHDGKGSTRFVRCGRCRELVCGSRVRIEGNQKIFRCHHQCGRIGVIEGYIESYDANKETDPYQELEQRAREQQQRRLQGEARRREEQKRVSTERGQTVLPKRTFLEKKND